ncbi:MAG: restriction endonuclease, partial [bacterium]
MPDPQISDPEKLLVEARPKIHKRIIATIKKLGPRLQQDGAPAIMGLLLGGIIAPLAAIDAPQGGVAQIITQIISGVGGNLLAGFIQKFYEADTEAAKQAVLTEIIQLLQAETEKSAQILSALQELITRVDALDAVRQAAGEAEAARLEQQFAWLRPIPADIFEHRRFAAEVKKLLRLQGAQVTENFVVGSEQRADFLVTHRGFVRPERTVVQCVTTKQGRADEQMLLSMLGWLRQAQKDGRADFGMIVTDSGLSPGAQAQAESHEWQVRRYDDLLADLMDFSIYLERRCDDFTKPRPESELPALKEYYVPLKARDERGGDKAE